MVNMPPLDTKSALETTVQDLYRVFQAYRLGQDFTGCDDCVDPRESARLATIPLEKLTAEDVRRYAFKALTTWGEVPHFKHFLPRLFELAADNPDQFTSIEVLFGKLAYGRWQEWPEFEQQAVDQFMRAFWAAELSREFTHERDDRLDTALCSLGQAYDDLSPFLEQWLSTESVSSCQQLAHFFLFNYEKIVGHRELWSAYWNGRSSQVSQIIDWMRTPAVYEYLFDREEQLAGRLSIVIPLLAEWQSTPASK
jgi:hypothetical protein